ncbi:hypothetical protein VTO42DRAFT_5112 [Malbranchea cinnamomea]
MEVSAPVFHPAKRRKFLRARPTGLDPAEDTTPDLPQPGEPSNVAESRPASVTESSETKAAEHDSEEAAISDILRRRKLHKARRVGIGFTADEKAGSHSGRRSPELALTELDEEKQRVLGISDRFVKHTGQKVELDKHMMAYVETEMAKRHYQNNPDAAVQTPADDEGPVRRASELQLPQRQPAALGKLHEIDLGPDTKLRNIERTEAATRMLAGGEGVPAGATEQQSSRNDGKSWRGRKRRNSEDIRRDQLVEEVLRESKLDVYEEPEKPQVDDDQAADDRIAEQFKREFLEAIQARRRARARNTKGGKGDAPRGPKLGGSRSARAAMREKQAKAARK